MDTSILTAGQITDAGYTKILLVNGLNLVAKISRPTLDKRLEDQAWNYHHLLLLEKLGFFGCEATHRLEWHLSKAKYKARIIEIQT